MNVYSDQTVYDHLKKCTEIFDESVSEFATQLTDQVSFSALKSHIETRRTQDSNDRRCRCHQSKRLIFGLSRFGRYVARRCQLSDEFRSFSVITRCQVLVRGI